MSKNLNRDKIWNDQVWKTIDDAVTTDALAIRVAQKVFDAKQLADVTSVPADVFHPDEMRISEGITKPYIEIAVEFPLTSGQVTGDPTGQTGRTLAKLATKSLALTEDLLFFQGKDVHLPPAVKIESGLEAAGNGLLGLTTDRRIRVSPPDPAIPTNSGAEILAAIAEGISRLTSEFQTQPFALILDTNAYAATWGSVINGAPTWTVLNSVLTGGIYGTAAMPTNTGLLVALGGDPTTIYFDDNPVTEHTQKDTKGRYFFRVYVRVQIVARDPRAFVRLDFPPLRAEKKRA